MGQFLKVSFYNKEADDICMIEVSHGDKPLYTNVTYKHGKKSETRSVSDFFF